MPSNDCSNHVIDIALNASPILKLGVMAALAVIVILTGCASRGVALRPSGQTNPPPAVANYIQSNESNGRKPYSCSFVEFDERGDYLDFQQHQDAWKRIRDLSIDHKEGLLLVIYCHGWKNNSQSDDVVEFVSFLRRLASAPHIAETGLRVHGVYLAWRGNSFKHALKIRGEEFSNTAADFGGSIVDTRHRRKIPGLLFVPEQLSYWSRKGAAESKVSGVPIARTIFTCADAAKQTVRTGQINRVFVIGHSFGALMLEKSLGQASVGALTGRWPWEPIKNAEFSIMARPPSNPLPFDCLLFVNSAAPSIHSKALSDLLWAHQSALERGRMPDADAPVVISVTSSADWATLYVHRIGNLFAGLMPSLWRDYIEGVLRQKPNAEAVRVPQSYFYQRTPGHNPLLVNRWIVNGAPRNYCEAPPANVPVAVLEHNLNNATEFPDVFYTTAPNGGKAVAWTISKESHPPDWSGYRGQKPFERGSYWIMRCDKSLIRGHNDVWSSTTMELYAALYRLAESKRK